MRRKKNFTKDDAIFFILIAITTVSLAHYTKGISEFVRAMRAENAQIAAVNQLPNTLERKKPKNTHVIYPNGGETLYHNEKYIIRWEGISDDLSENQVQILLFPWESKDILATKTIAAIIATSTANTGVYSWVVSTSIPEGEYFVRIFCITFFNCPGSAGDDSDTPIFISKEAP